MPPTPPHLSTDGAFVYHLLQEMGEGAEEVGVGWEEGEGTQEGGKLQME